MGSAQLLLPIQKGPRGRLWVDGHTLRPRSQPAAAGGTDHSSWATLAGPILHREEATCLSLSLASPLLLPTGRMSRKAASKEVWEIKFPESQAQHHRAGCIQGEFGVE